MEEIKLVLDNKGQGAFFIMEDGQQLGEMVISISGASLTVYHTEVDPKAEGRGYAKKLLDAMTTHARANSLKVIPLCPYVHVQFRRHPLEYADIWKKENESSAEM